MNPKACVQALIQFQKCLIANVTMRELLTEIKLQELLGLAKRYQSYGVCGEDGKTHHPKDCWMIQDLQGKLSDALGAKAESAGAERQVIKPKSSPNRMPKMPPAPLKELCSSRQVKPLEVFKLQGGANSEHIVQVIIDGVEVMTELAHLRLKHGNINMSVIVWGKGEDGQVHGYLIDYDFRPITMEATEMLPESIPGTYEPPGMVENFEATKNGEGLLVHETPRLVEGESPWE
ncbi:hypothetical protein FRB93_003172 [Tulasnella sp. JGI-2019a]|nr:hypothetical protein FRB93_003172 [Tulasnella sp. JGI-2019a]